MVLKLLFYGSLADLVGRELDIDSPSGCSLSELRRSIVALSPEAARALADHRVRAYVHDHFVGDEYIVSNADCVEFLSPVSGG